MGSEGRRWLVVATMVAASALLACRRPATSKAAPDGGAPDAAPPAAAVSAFVFDGEAELLGLAWAPNGDVVAHTPAAILRFAPREDAPARILRPAAEDAWERVTVARDADVIAALGVRGALVAFEGATRRALGAFPDARRVEIAPDGKHVAVQDGSAVHVVDVARGAQTTSLGVAGRLHHATIAFDDSGRWIAVSAPRPSKLPDEPELDQTLVRRVDGEGPETALANLALDAWVGDKLVFVSERALVVATPGTTTKPRRVPICEGSTWHDHALGRVVVRCVRQVDVVNLSDGTRRSFPVPELTDGDADWIAATREGDDVLVSVGGTALRLDTRGRVTKLEPGVLPPLRDGRGRALADVAEAELAACESCQRAPMGDRWMRALGHGAKGWPVEIRAKVARMSGTPEVSWGPTRLRSWSPSPRPNAGGLDFEHEVDHGAATRGRVRVGPDAAMLPDEPPHSEGRAARDDCPARRHVSLPTGELWFCVSGFAAGLPAILERVPRWT